MSSVYFYEKAGQQAGPVEGDQLVPQGVTATTLVWREGMIDWVAAGTVPELRNLFTSLAPACPRPTLTPPVGPIKHIHSSIPVAPATPPIQVALIIGLVVLVALGALWVSPLKHNVAEPEHTAQESAAPAQDEEIKEIGYAANHMHDEEVEVPEDREEEVTEEPAASRLDTYYWYGCSSCGKLLTASSTPGYSRCPAKTGTSGTEHAWEKLGQIGDTQYTCYFCAASVSTESRPEPGKCLMSPNKGATSGLGHQWEESGVPINRF